MSSEKQFNEQSYQQHSKHYEDFAPAGNKGKDASKWFEKDTVDAWRHRRMYEVLDPILKSDNNAKWLTVGDGRCGTDAHYILEQGGHALASDISDTLLKTAKEAGFISEYKKENAESLSFQDAEFDYVLCKESYHHFPRPMLALYEMLRVAKKGIVLIEPNDGFIHSVHSNILHMKLMFRGGINFVRGLLGKSSCRHSYEESGNYTYSISRREIEKVALGMNYQTVAFTSLNDCYLPGVEDEKLSQNGPLQRKVRKDINRNNLLCSLGIKDYQYLVAVIFKQPPSKELLQQLAQDNYEVMQLPSNPYISG